MAYCAGLITTLSLPGFAIGHLIKAGALPPVAVLPSVGTHSSLCSKRPLHQRGLGTGLVHCGIHHPAKVHERFTAMPPSTHPLVAEPAGAESTSSRKGTIQEKASRRRGQCTIYAKLDPCFLCSRFTFGREGKKKRKWPVPLWRSFSGFCPLLPLWALV